MYGGGNVMQEIDKALIAGHLTAFFPLHQSDYRRLLIRSMH